MGTNFYDCFLFFVAMKLIFLVPCVECSGVGHTIIKHISGQSCRYTQNFAFTKLYVCCCTILQHVRVSME